MHFVWSSPLVFTYFRTEQMFNTNPTTRPFPISSHTYWYLLTAWTWLSSKSLSIAMTKAGVWISKDFLPCITGFPTPAGEPPTTHSPWQSYRTSLPQPSIYLCCTVRSPSVARVGAVQENAHLFSVCSRDTEWETWPSQVFLLSQPTASAWCSTEHINQEQIHKNLVSAQLTMLHRNLRSFADLWVTK